ncbi:MAG TPA: SDR family oxidoreductase [Thermoanaerobaculia bacterium]
MSSVAPAASVAAPQQVVVITGASAGIGRALARKFGSRKAKVGLVARGLEGLEAARREIELLGGQAVVLQADVADADAVERAAQKAEETLGPIDVWINNAAASVLSPVRELKPDEIRRVTEVTYLGYVYGTMSALRRMLPRDRGTIVQVGSALAHRGIPIQAANCGAKHAIQGFERSLWAELRHDGSSVRLMEVNLPAVNTPQFDWVLSRLPNRAQPAPPIFQPELIADAIVWAVDHPRRTWNLGWTTTKAVVGNAFFPGRGDSFLAKRGVESQQTEEPEDPDRPHNLWSPLPGDHGARGRFSDRAADVSLHMFLNRYRKPILVAGSLLLAAGVAKKVLGRRRK